MKQITEGSTNSPLGSYHWFQTIIGKHKRIGEFLMKHDNVNTNDLKAWGESLFNTSNELLSGYKFINTDTSTEHKSNDPYSPYAAWITPQQVYEAQQKQKNAESVDDICIKCKYHDTFDVYCDECTDTNDNYQPKTKEE